MKEINELNSVSLDYIRSKLSECLDEMGLTPNIGGITYDGTSFSVSVKGTLKWNKDNQKIDPKFEEWKKYHVKKGVPFNWFGKVIQDNEGDYLRISGIKPRGRKNVIELTRVRDGKIFICPKTYVLIHLIESKPTAEIEDLR